MCTTTTGDETYTYDDAGNRLTAQGTTFTYDGEGQLASCTSGCTPLAHDTAGRMSSIGGWTYTYDAEGRLTVATETASGDRLEMSDDGEGHRTPSCREVAAGTLTLTRDLRYQGDAIVEEKVTDAGHPSGTIVRTYTVTDAGQVVSVTIPAGETAAGTYLVTWNGHGDALALWRKETNGTLTLANSYTYSSWGTPTTATHNSVPDLGFRFLYVGAADVQWDGFSGADLAYMHARHYRPSIGRSPAARPERSGSESLRVCRRKSGDQDGSARTIPDRDRDRHLHGEHRLRGGATCSRGLGSRIWKLHHIPPNSVATHQNFPSQ